MSRKCDLPLHGLTVAIDTTGPRLVIGRYDYEDDDAVVVKDADDRSLAPDQTKDAYLARSAKFGVFRNVDFVRVPKGEILSMRLLSEIAEEIEARG